MEELRYKKTYMEYKQELDQELTKTAEGFVRIGYLLKLARDTDVLMESGYANVIEFAEAEYSIDKSQVSRFIAINDEFSEGGYGDHLKIEYQRFGYAKLALMLRLPSELNQVLTADYSKAEIQAIKDEVDEERKISDLEVLMETETEATAIMSEELTKTIKQLGADDCNLFADMWNAIKKGDQWNVSCIQTMMAPSGQKIYSVRIRGVGRKMLSVKDPDNGGEVALIDIRTNEKQLFTWENMLSAWDTVAAGSEAGSYRDAWEELYGAEWPREEVAPVQLQKEKKDAPKKESKVQKAPKEPVKPKKIEWKSKHEPGDIVMDTISGTVGELLKKTDSDAVWIFQTAAGEEYNLQESCMGSTPEKQDDVEQKSQEPMECCTEQEEGQQDQQLPGQTSIETDFPEIIPESEAWKLCMSKVEAGAKEIIRFAEQMMYEEAIQQIQELGHHIRDLKEITNRMRSDQA